MNSMKQYRILRGFFMALMASGCTNELIKDRATGGYKVATDERNASGMWDNSAVTSKVKTELLKGAHTTSFQIDVVMLEGKVLLTSVVEKKEESKRAVEMPNSETGVIKVTNNLQIGERSFGQSADDTAMGSRSRAKLAVEPRIRSLDVDADIYNGVVTSTGIVNSSD